MRYEYLLPVNGGPGTNQHSKPSLESSATYPKVQCLHGTKVIRQLAISKSQWAQLVKSAMPVTLRSRVSVRNNEEKR